MISLLEAVDAVKDPDPSSRYVVCVKGPIREEPPKVSIKVSNKARRWMVDEDWLVKEENQIYDTEWRIIESGKAWGDEEDPEVLIAKRAKVKEEKRAVSTSKKRQMVGSSSRKTKKQKHSSKVTSVKGKEKQQEPESGSEGLSFDESA